MPYNICLDFIVFFYFYFINLLCAQETSKPRKKFSDYNYIMYRIKLCVFEKKNYGFMVHCRYIAKCCMCITKCVGKFFEFQYN